MPIFRKGLGPHALPLAMSGVKPGERLLYLGSGRPGLFAALAYRAGLNGRACALADGPRQEEALRRAAAREGVLVEIATGTSGAFPYDAEAFDVAVVDSTDGAFGALPAADRSRRLREVARVVRGGGRLVVVERTASGLRALFAGAPAPAEAGYRAQGGAKPALEEAGFRPVRLLAERERYRFTEGIKPAARVRA
jgi:ubiquinone/menaquinone biosynthesis C-methylase UbiE